MKDIGLRITLTPLDRAQITVLLQILRKHERSRRLVYSKNIYNPRAIFRERYKIYITNLQVGKTR